MKKVLKLTQGDTVATALQEIKAGETFEIVLSGQKAGEMTAVSDIPYGFKAAVRGMKPGDPVIKYSHVIGRASRGIAEGELVHVHNIEGNRGRGDLAADGKGRAA